jgi:hypothetical protein
MEIGKWEKPISGAHEPIFEEFSRGHPGPALKFPDG